MWIYLQAELTGFNDGLREGNKDEKNIIIIQETEVPNSEMQEQQILKERDQLLTQK